MYLADTASQALFLELLSLDMPGRPAFNRSVQGTAKATVCGTPVCLWQLFNSMQRHGGAKFDAVRGAAVTSPQPMA